MVQPPPQSIPAVKPDSAEVNLSDHSHEGLLSADTARDIRERMRENLRNQREIIAEEDTKAGMMRTMDSANIIEEDLKVIRHIYENFEKHTLPNKQPRDLKAALKKLPIGSSLDGDTEILNRAKDTLLYETYKRF